MPTLPTSPDPAFPRLAPDRTLPPYRYVPGRAPHPTRHPDGHSHGEPEPIVFLPRGPEWGRAPEHLFALDLFNHAYWWEAHEVWEGLWRAVDGGTPDKLALQGLIQAAACLLKTFVGHHAAAARLSGAALMRMEAATTHGLVRGGPLLALDLQDFASRFSRHVENQGPYPHLFLVVS